MWSKLRFTAHTFWRSLESRACLGPTDRAQVGTPGKDFPQCSPFLLFQGTHLIYGFKLHHFQDAHARLYRYLAMNQMCSKYSRAHLKASLSSWAQEVNTVKLKHSRWAFSEDVIYCIYFLYFMMFWHLEALQTWEGTVPLKSANS